MHQILLVPVMNALTSPATLTLAQRTTTGGEAAPAAPAGDATGAAQGAPAGGGTFFFIIMAFMVLMIVMTIMSGRKQRKQKQQMLSALGKNDRIQTIGGVIGTVIEIRDNEVLVETDRASGTRIRFSKAAVQQVLRSASGGAQSEAAEPKIEPAP